jgi:ssDNA-binding Zn-finger/Zn-ribbon topoisomerase 1
MADKRVGIECPECGSGSRVLKTDNWNNFIIRVRVCDNANCRKTFRTCEEIVAIEGKNYRKIKDVPEK